MWGRPVVACLPASCRRCQAAAGAGRTCVRPRPDPYQRHATLTLALEPLTAYGGCAWPGSLPDPGSCCCFAVVAPGWFNPAATAAGSSPAPRKEAAITDSVVLQPCPLGTYAEAARPVSAAGTCERVSTPPPLPRPAFPVPFCPQPWYLPLSPASDSPVVPAYLLATHAHTSSPRVPCPRSPPPPGTCPAVPHGPHHRHRGLPHRTGLRDHRPRLQNTRRHIRHGHPLRSGHLLGSCAPAGGSHHLHGLPECSGQHRSGRRLRAGLQRRRLPHRGWHSR